MASLSKRKFRKEEDHFQKRKKLQKEDDIEEIESDSNPVVKVKNEFATLFEEAELKIQESVEDIKPDIFDFQSSGNDNYLPSNIGHPLGHNSKGSAASARTNKIRNMKNATIAKIIDKQNEALKLIRIALMKFESVTKDLQEVVECDIVESQAQLDKESYFVEKLTANNGDGDNLTAVADYAAEILTAQDISDNIAAKDNIHDSLAAGNKSHEHLSADSDVSKRITIANDDTENWTSPKRDIIWCVSADYDNDNENLTADDKDSTCSSQTKNAKPGLGQTSSPSAPDAQNNGTSVPYETQQSDASYIYPDISINVDERIVQNEMSNNTTKKILSVKEKFQETITLPVFSQQVLPYLLGENLVEIERKRTFNLLVNELISHLDNENLLLSSGSNEQSIGYSVLQSKLLAAYPNIITEPPKTTRKKVSKGKLGSLTCTISDRRRKRRERMKKMNEHIYLNSDELLNLLQARQVVEWKEPELLYALKQTRDLRSAYVWDEECFPHYLLHADALKQEVEMILKKDIAEMSNFFIKVMKKFRTFKIRTFVELVDFLNEEESEHGTGFISEGEFEGDSLPENYLGPRVLVEDISSPSRALIQVTETKGVIFENIEPICASIIGFGVYYIRDISYPKSYRQILGFLQCIFTSHYFNDDSQNQHLKMLLNEI